MHLAPTVGYIFFDEEVALPSHYDIGVGYRVPLNLETHIIGDFGLVLPLMRVLPDGIKINRDYFQNEEFANKPGPLFITLDSDDYVNEYHVSKETLLLETWPCPKIHSRFIRTDAYAFQPQLNRNMEKIYSIDSAIMQFEKISGIPGDTYRIYKREELAALVKGEIKIEDVSFKPGKTQYEFIWLGE